MILLKVIKPIKIRKLNKHIPGKDKRETNTQT